MRTRNAGTPKSAAGKKTPPARKSATKVPRVPQTPPPESGTESATPKTTETRSASASKAKIVKNDETTPSTEADSKAEQPVEQGEASVDAGEVTPGPKVATGSKTTKTVARKTPARTKTPPSSKTVSRQTPKLGETENEKAEEYSRKEEAEDGKDVDSAMMEESSISNVDESAKKEESYLSNVEESAKKGESSLSNVEESAKKVGSSLTNVDESAKMGESSHSNVEESAKKVESSLSNVEESARKDESSLSNVEESARKEDLSISNVEESIVENVEETKREDNQNVEDVLNVEESKEEEEKNNGEEQPLILDVAQSTGQEDPIDADVSESSKTQEAGRAREEEEEGKEEMEEMRIIEDNMGPEHEPVNMEEDIDKELKGKDARLGDKSHGEDKMEECRGQEVLEEFGEEDALDPGREAVALEVEHMEVTAAANEHKIRKELEIFVGGLDRDAVEEDVKKAFENIGEVVDVRLHKNPSTNKNKGYAFVKFATKEQASRALLDMKNPLIRGKRCGTAPSEDNATLFLGNICNTWTKEAINQKLKDYGIKGVENITLVPDAQREGLSRGFAFLEFSCHADAMLAYKRLQKPDAIFGHSERTAKVAFAEPLREPDPDVMAQVKSVFVDGLPPHWDEDRIREQLKSYGEIVRIMLARNLSTTKRKDFGFVDFTTHEAAVACVDGINNTNFSDDNSKTKVKARLSNPLPKTQAVKGGMCGGFRIGRSGAGSFTRFGRGFGRGGHAFNQSNFHRGRGFYPRGRGQTWRMGFPHEHDPDMQYPPFQRREMFGRGGWRDTSGSFDASSGGVFPARPNLDRSRHDALDRGRGRHITARRPPFPPAEGFNRPFIGRHFDDPYFYDDSARGIKRPFFMTDEDPDYMEPSRLRPRMGYHEPTIPLRAAHYQDSFGAGSSLHSHDYYGPDYREGSYSSFYGNDRPYGGGYYY